SGCSEKWLHGGLLSTMFQIFRMALVPGGHKVSVRWRRGIDAPGNRPGHGCRRGRMQLLACAKVQVARMPARRHRKDEIAIHRGMGRPDRARETVMGGNCQSLRTRLVEPRIRCDDCDRGVSGSSANFLRADV